MFSIDHVHPMVVHFPIALLYAGFFCEFIYLFFKKDPLFSEAGFWLLCVGAISAAAAYASGALLTKELYGAAGDVQSSHELFAEITTIMALVLAAFKIYLRTEKKEDSNLKWIAFAIYTFIVAMVSITGYYGGVLVYDYLIPK
jgi:uncharacterized membrane protein